MKANAMREEGFTLIELLVVMSLLSIVTVGFYQVMFSGARGSDITQSLVRISEEARGGLNRMIRDTRQSEVLVSASSTSYRVQVDFDGSGEIEGDLDDPNPATGDFEELLFVYDADEGTITLNGETLVDGVEQIGTKPMFSYYSNDLTFDLNGDGVADEAEINASSLGNGTNGLDLVTERALVSTVVFQFAVRSENRITEFYGEAQMRNNR
jgi:prepilin-type N-terminal cleavage/methylation domain-containing protein